MNTRILLFGVSAERCKDMVEPDTILEARGFGEEINTIEGEFFEHIAARNVIEFTVEAERKGFDAILIGCFLDPGLKGARELVKIPVIGAGEATLHLAAMLSAGKFSVLAPQRKVIPAMTDKARAGCLNDKISSWRSLDLSVVDLYNDAERTRTALVREGKAAVEQDGAEVVCLGCTALFGRAQELQDELGVPVLDPVVVGLAMAELQAKLWRRLKVSHSKVGGYKTPPQPELANAYSASYNPLKKLLYTFKNRYQRG